MAGLEQTDEVFKEFTKFSTSYATRGTHPIAVHVLLPPNLPSGPRPVLVNFHGGYLVTGAALWAPVFPPFILSLAKRHSAVLVSVDYTLLPHPAGLSLIHADLADFHAWLHSPALPALLGSSAAPDLSRVLVHGSSAGGYLALAYALVHASSMRALSLVYPMIDFSTDWWRRGSRAVGATNPMGFGDETFPTDEAVRARIEKLRAEPLVTAAGMERTGLGMAIARAGLFHEVFSPAGSLDADDTVWLEKRVKEGSEKLPRRVWVLHGTGDTAVPADTSLAFADVMKAQGRPVRLDTVEGKEHGFDAGPSEDWQGPEDPLILDATAWLAEDWLREDGKPSL